MFTIKKTLYHVKQIQVKMIMDRGYEVDHSEKEVLNMTEEEFFIVHPDPKTIRQELTRMYIHPETNIKLYVFYAERTGTKSVGKKTAEMLAQQSDNPETTYDKIVIISPVELSSDFKKIFEALKNKINMQMFYENQLTYNPILHSFVPLHVRLSESEREIFYKRNMVKPGKIPLMNIDDPIARYYDFQIGDVIRITRTNNFLITPITKIISYREVVK